MVVIRDLTRLDALDGYRSVHDGNDFRLAVVHKYHLLSYASVSAEIEYWWIADARFGGRQLGSDGKESTRLYVLKPFLEDDGVRQQRKWNDVSGVGLLQTVEQSAAVDDMAIDQDGILCQIAIRRPMGHDVQQRLPRNEGFTLPV